MADRIVVMQGGHIEQVGRPLEVYDRPANTFVAGFIGSPAMNMLDAVIRHEGGAVVAETGGVRLPLDGAALEDGRNVILGIRPEHLLMAQDGLSGEIAVVEPTGSETHVIVRTGGRELTALVRERQEFAPGQPVHLRPAAGMVHVFDGQTRARVS